MALTGQQTLHGSTCRQIRNKTSVLQAKICSGVKFYIDNFIRLRHELLSKSTNHGI